MRLEDQLRAGDSDEQKRNRIREAEAEAGLSPRGVLDPYAPYQTPGDAPSGDPYQDQFGASSPRLPLVSHASPFQRADMYDEYEDRNSYREEEYDTRSALTSNRDDSISHYGSESYAPSRNMFQNSDNKILLEKDALAGELQEGEVAEVIKETSARRRWVAVCWILTFWVPTIFLKWFGRMKRPDVQQAWREKLALNMLIWFVCGCTVFVIAVMGAIICPTAHVYSISELASHSQQNNPNNVFTSIRGEIFDLTQVAATHARIVPVVSTTSILKYGGTASDAIFPVQVRVSTFDTTLERS
jgi:chitin synthase